MTLLDQAVSRVRDGARVDAAEALALYQQAPLPLLGELANAIHLRRHPDPIVTYIIDRNVNYTNVCVARCAFCAFYRPVGSGEGYVLAFDEIHRKIEETIELGGGQLLLQGGHNPDVPLEWYEDLFRGVKQRWPSFRLHALSPPEVLHISRLSKLSVPAVIDRLIAAGLDSIPGGGAEILVDRARKLMNCYSKASADEWISTMRHAHLAGLRTTATMMYGSVETEAERIEHMMRLRALQDETGGFQTFIPLALHPANTKLDHLKKPSVLVDLRTMAVSRLMLDNFPHIKGYWATLTPELSQVSLDWGVTDVDGTLIEERIVHMAGSPTPEGLSKEQLAGFIRSAGRIPVERDAVYNVVKVWAEQAPALQKEKVAVEITRRAEA